MDNKENQRKKVLKLWQQLVNRDGIEHELQSRLIQTDVWNHAQMVGITISKGLEWDTRYLIKQAWMQGKQIAIPKSNRDNHSMAFYLYQEGDQLENVWSDLWEPSIPTSLQIAKQEIDLMIVPGIVFDKKGFRIGYGGGFYDRYLQGYKGVTVSLAADFQIVGTVAREKHDKPIDILISNFGKIYCHHT
ncbi:5-formyltetrahydrofolate cyclo-ligase [Gracilibacillus sp. HCP3S3_G5_1]|uniref:5-formyltetrahydrofolate cyclo-ligase n=1 Tax=unclassified Gracilibacillus TaxID=2625209 RepID=UPI003F8B84A4